MQKHLNPKALRNGQQFGCSDPYPSVSKSMVFTISVNSVTSVAGKYLFCFAYSPAHSIFSMLMRVLMPAHRAVSMGVIMRSVDRVDMVVAMIGLRHNRSG